MKDGINNYVVHGQQSAVNPDKTGTKVSAHYQANVGAGKTAVIRLRLSNIPPQSPVYQGGGAVSPGKEGKGGAADKPFDEKFDAIFARRLQEADRVLRLDYYSVARD